MTVRYINLTPHALYVKAMDGEYITILPDPQPDIVFIVAKAVADAAPAHRGDLMSPGRLLRDAEGKVVGCDGLTRRA